MKTEVNLPTRFSMYPYGKLLGLLDEKQETKLYLLIANIMRTVSKPTKRTLLRLETEDSPHSAVIELLPDDVLVVSVLRENNSSVNSFVEIRLASTDPLYGEIKDAISALNILGAGEEIEGVGYCAGGQLYHVYISKELHAKILNQ